MENNNTYLIEIDYLRGVAILLTLIAHLAFMQTTPSPIYMFLINHIAQFWGGVILFFTISGYVISRSFMANFSLKQAPFKKDFKFACKIFYLRRFYRIIPTAFSWILITIIFSINFNYYNSFGPINSILKQAIAAVFFIYNALTPWIAGASLSIYWSLSFEEQFYLIFPFLCRLNNNLKIFVLLNIIFLFFFIHRPADQSRLITSFPLDAICYGVLIDLLHRKNLANKIKPSFLLNKKWNHINLSVTLAIIIFSPIIFKNITCGTSLLVAAGAWLVFCASFGNGYIKPSQYMQTILKNIGKVSFSLYCSHMNAYLISKELTFHLAKIYQINPFYLNFISLIFSFFFCTLFSLTSYILIEKTSRSLSRNKTKNSIIKFNLGVTI